MTIREQLSQELEQSSYSLIEEILDFCLFLKQRQQAKVNNQSTETKTNGILDLSTCAELFTHLANVE